MPVRTCLFCGCLCVIETEQLWDGVCTLCLDTPRAIAGSDAAIQIRPSHPMPLHGSLDRECVGLDGAPQGITEWGRRRLIASAEAAVLKEWAQSLRSQARRLRGAAELLPPESGGAGAAWPTPVSILEPAERSAPCLADGGGDRLNPEILRGRQLLRQARALVERARSAHLRARITRGMARASREDVRRRASLPLELPPLDYVLLPPGAPLPALIADDEDEPAGDPVDDMLPVWPAAAPSARKVTLFVWGYELPRSLFCREQCDDSAAAAQFAIAAGWEAKRPGAWAREITLPCGLSEALRGLKQVLQQDPAVAGWGVRYRRMG